MMVDEAIYWHPFREGDMKVDDWTGVWSVGRGGRFTNVQGREEAEMVWPWYLISIRFGYVSAWLKWKDLTKGLEDFLSCELKVRVLYIYIYIYSRYWSEGQSFYLKDKISLLVLYLKVSVYLYYILFFLLEYVIKWLNLPYFNNLNF